MKRAWRAAFAAAVLLGASSCGVARAAAQSAPHAAPRQPALFPSDVRFAVRVDASALAGSPLLDELLRRPEAANGLARALARPSTLARVDAVYLGLPDAFTPATTELPVLVLGDFAADEMLADLGEAPGVQRVAASGGSVLEAEGGPGTTVAAALGDGALAIGDEGSVSRLREVWSGAARGVPAPLPEDVSGDLVGGGSVPAGLRNYLQSAAGGLAAPFAGVDRLTFSSTLGQAVRVRASLHAPSAEGRQALQQALGALVIFGPSRFANDPEVLSAVQSLRFTVGAETVDVSVTLPRSLLLRLL